MATLAFGLERDRNVRDLTQAEQLVLYGFRATALGHGDCPVLRRTYQGLLGSEADAALCDLLVFVRLIGVACARRVRLHAPGCCRVSRDEQIVLNTVAAAQGALAGEEDAELRGCLTELLSAVPSDAALLAAQAFAAALMVRGLKLLACVEPPPSATLH